MTDFRLAVMTTTFERPELTRAVLEWWDMLDVPFAGAVVGGVPSPTGYTKWEWENYPNRPLGRKHNAALDLAREANPDAVMVIGSDDLVQPELIQRSVDAIKAGALWTQPKTLYFWHPATGRVSTPSINYVTGAGRVYSRRLLDVMGWRLWDDDAESKLDGNACKNIREALWSKKIWVGEIRNGSDGGTPIEGAVLDIKTGVNMWNYDEATGITQARDVDPAILETFEIERLNYEYEPV